MKELLQAIGLEPQRVEMFNMSSTMAAEFVTRAQEMTERIQALGPSPLRRAGVDQPPEQPSDVVEDDR
ncbi:MAG: hypothetical protein Kow00124_10420 [Anaerolineae bacterium]